MPTQPTVPIPQPSTETAVRAISTGTLSVHRAFERARGRGPGRFAWALLDRQFSDELPIHAWLINHPDGPILVDAGELATTSPPPVARFSVRREHEIDLQLAAIGLRASDLRHVVLTHLHGDHINGLARLPRTRVLASAEALERGGSRALARRGVVAEPLSLTAEPFGAFTGSLRLTDDGRVVAVPVPGHARGQIAVIIVDGDRHIMLGADSAFTQQQLLDLHPDGVSFSARTAIQSMHTILEHAHLHTTVFLPSHDPQSAARLTAREALADTRLPVLKSGREPAAR